MFPFNQLSWLDWVLSFALFCASVTYLCLCGFALALWLGVVMRFLDARARLAGEGGEYHHVRYNLVGPGPRWDREPAAPASRREDGFVVWT